jgi:4-methyl-5(b-hydroxyethyl)-thiazole monophosphate biosynthesis
MIQLKNGKKRSKMDKIYRRDSIMSKVYIFLADGFEDIEALTVVDLMRRARIDITTVSIKETRTVTTSHGITLQADSLFTETDFTDADMLVLPGGMPGTKYLDEYEPLTDLLQSFYIKGGKVAAICAAPSVFARLGFLEGRKATSYPSFMEKLTGARTTEEPVAVDGNVTTSRGLGTAIDFALSLIGQLAGMEKAHEIAESIVYF